MSLKKELNKIGDKIDNATKDKDERAQDCFDTFKANGITMVDAKTGVPLTHPLDSVGRVSAGEGNMLDYCLDEYREKGYISESEYMQDHPLHVHVPILDSLIS